MVKKTIATLQSDIKKVTKVIKCVKKEKTGAYSFKKECIDTNKIQTNNVV